VDKKLARKLRFQAGHGHAQALLGYKKRIRRLGKAFVAA
jgi:hypothetical protein